MMDDDFDALYAELLGTGTVVQGPMHPLWSAIIEMNSNDVEVQVNNLNDIGSSVDCVGPRLNGKKTPLIAACSYVNETHSEKVEDEVYKVVKLLLNNMVEREQECLDKALIAAVKSCRYRVSKFLIQNGANVNAVDPHRRRYNRVVDCLLARKTITKVHSTEMFDILKLLVKNNAGLESKPKQKTCLIKAVTRQDYNLCKFLIEQGVDMNAKDRHGSTALFYAAGFTWPSNPKNKECCHMVSIQAYEYSSFHRITCGICDDDIDLSKEQKRIVELLLVHKADITVRNKAGETCLLRAVKTGNYDLTKLMIEQGTDVNACDYFGNSALHLATQNEYGWANPFDMDDDKRVCKLLELLVENNADLHKKNNNGETCLYTAVNQGFLNASKFLINAGVYVNAANSVTGNTALHIAVEHNSIPIVNLLCNYGASILKQNKHGDDILQYACLHRRINMFDRFAHLYSPERVIDAYKLIACATISAAIQSWALGYPTSELMDEAVSLWKKGITFQLQYPPLLNFNDEPEYRPKLAFKDVVEIETLEELDNMKSDFNALLEQVVIIYYRILGPIHSELDITIHLLNVELQDNPAFSKSNVLEVKKYELEHEMKNTFRDSDCTHMIIFNMKRFFYSCLNNNDFDYNYRFSDAFDIMAFITEVCFNALQQTRGLDLAVCKISVEMLTYYPFLLFILFLRIPTSEEITALQKLVYKINVIQSFVGVPHMLLKGVCRLQGLPSNLHCATIVDILLKCGGEVNAVDGMKQSALHIAALRTTLDIKTVDVLIKHGGHVDQADKDGRRVYELLQGRYELDMLSHINLQCLAAQTVKRYSIPYIKEVPTLLHQFIEMH